MPVEAALSESEALFRTMADSAPVLLWMAGLDGECHYFNRGWLEFTGRTMEQEVGVGWAEGVHFEDFQNCMLTYTEAFAARRRFRMEYRLRRADGQYRWVLDTGVPRWDADGAFAGFIGSCIDITEIREANDALARSAGVLERRMRERNRELEKQKAQALDLAVEAEAARQRAENAHQQFRALLEAAPDSMVAADARGRIVLANGRARQVFGYAAEELAGAPMAMLLPAWEGKQPQAGETWARRKDGGGFPADVTLSPMASDQGPSLIASIRDITLRKQAEEATRKSLVEKEALLKEIHHRVKNNLQIVSSLLRLQASRIRDEKDREMMRESEERVNSMSLIHEMLYQGKDISRVQFGDYVAGLTSELLQGYAVDPGRVKLELDVEPVDLDINWAIPLGLIINELVSNALKYAFPGGRSGIIRLLLAVRDGDLVLEVGDDGVGLPGDLEARRAGSLGLQIVDSLSRQLGGEPRFSDEGGGTRFRLTVKL
jgi:PAS domain S-box-containing protein